MAILKTARRCDWCLQCFCDLCQKCSGLEKAPRPGKCEQCDMDLCVRCAQALSHKTVRRADDGLPPVYECPESCVRWGQGPLACIQAYGHRGPCCDRLGNTTMTFTAEILGRAQ